MLCPYLPTFVGDSAFLLLLFKLYHFAPGTVVFPVGTQDPETGIGGRIFRRRAVTVGDIDEQIGFLGHLPHIFKDGPEVGAASPFQLKCLAPEGAGV